MGIKDNSRNRLHTKGWIRKRVSYQEEIARRTKEQILENEVNVRVRQQKIAQELQIKGLRELKKKPIKDAKTAFRMLLAGLQEERAAVGLNESKSIQEPSKFTGKTYLDEKIERMSYEELLGLIAEIKKIKEERSVE
jgi:hypothetical protein